MALSESQSDLRPPRLSLAAPIAQWRAWLADRSDRSVTQRVAGAVFVIRVISAALIYASQMIFARWMGSFEFGIYVYVWTWVLLIGDIADLGLASAAQRFIPIYTKNKTFDLLRGFLARSRWLSLATACLIAAASALAVDALRPWLTDYLELPLSIACCTLPFYALMQMQDGIARSYDWIRLALVPPYLVRHLLMLGLMAAAYLFGLPTTAVTAIAAVALSFAVTVIGQTVVLNRQLSHTVEHGPKTYAVKNWFAISLPIFFIDAFYLLLTNADVLVLQYFRSPEEIGIYYAAAKTLMLVAFVHFAVSAAVAHRFTAYHVSEDHGRLNAFLRDSIRWTFWASVAATVAMLIAGRLLLALFGAGFGDGYYLMFILTIGLLARASIGPAARLLSMLGEQRNCALAYAAAFGLNLVLCFALIPSWGIEGAAIATSAALVFETVLLFCIAKVRLRLHVFIWQPRAGG